MKRTKAIEILDSLSIPYQLGEFDASEFTAEEVASKLHIPLESVFKTLVVRGEKSSEAMAVIPGDKELSLKKMAGALKTKRAEMVKIEELQRITGYLKGGCSPLGSKKPLPVFIDESARSHPTISVSAGQRGLQILIAADALAQASKAVFADLSES